MELHTLERRKEMTKEKTKTITRLSELRDIINNLKDGEELIVEWGDENGEEEK